MIGTYDKIDLEVLYKNDNTVLGLLNFLEDLENDNEELQETNDTFEKALGNSLRYLEKTQSDIENLEFLLENNEMDSNLRKVFLQQLESLKDNLDTAFRHVNMELI